MAARYLPKLSVTSEQCRVSRPQFPQSTHGTPGTMTPLLARKSVAFYDSGFPTEARVKIAQNEFDLVSPVLINSVLFVNKVLTTFTCDKGSEKGTGANEMNTRDPLL